MSVVLMPRRDLERLEHVLVGDLNALRRRRTRLPGPPSRFSGLLGLGACLLDQSRRGSFPWICQDSFSGSMPPLAQAERSTLRHNLGGAPL